MCYQSNRKMMKDREERDKRAIKEKGDKSYGKWIEEQ